MNIQMVLLREYKRLGMSEESVRKNIIDTLHKEQWNNLALGVLNELKTGSSEDRLKTIKIQLEELASNIEEAKVKADKFK